MPLTYKQLAFSLAEKGYTREEFASVLKELTGEDYYASDPNTYIEDDFSLGMQEGTTPLQSPEPPGTTAQRTVTADPQLTFEQPAAMQFQQQLEQQMADDAAFFAMDPSPTEWVSTPTRPHPDPRRALMGQRQVVPPRPMSTQELAAASGRPPESLEYPEEYQQTFATLESIKEDPMTEHAEARQFGAPPEGSAVIESMEGKRLSSRKEYDPRLGEVVDIPTVVDVEPEAEDASMLDVLTGGFVGMPGPGLQGRQARLDEAQLEEQRLEGLTSEFREQAVRPAGEMPLGLSGAPDPEGLIKAGMDPFDFAGLVMDNDTISTWHDAMWERLIQVFEVPVEKAIEGDLRLQRLLREDEWNSDEDMEFSGFTQFMPGVGWSLDTAKTNTLKASDRRSLERLWDMKDAEVVQAIEDQLEGQKAKAALYPALTNARKSVGNLANGLWEMGVSLVGGNIPVKAWQAKSVSERKQILEEQARDAIDETFGKGMAAFVIAALANPTSAVEVYPAELSFMSYRPMKALATPAAKAFVRSMDGVLTAQGMKGPIRAKVVTGLKRWASATERALADPAAHYTKGGEEFLQQTGRESALAETAIVEGMDTVSRSITQKIADEGGPLETIPASQYERIGSQYYRRGDKAEIPDASDPAAMTSYVESLQTATPESALEMGIVQSVPEVYPTATPEAFVTPRRQLGYDYGSRVVTISGTTGQKLRPARKVEGATKRDPQPTLLPDEAMDMIRDLNEIFGEDGALVRGLVTEEGLAQQVAAAVDNQLANQLTSPEGRASVVDIVLEEASQQGWGGRMPGSVKRTMRATVREAIDDAAGRMRGEGGTSQVYNPIFEIEARNGNVININTVQALARAQRSNPEFMSKVQEGTLGYVNRRVGAQARARGVQNGVMNQIVRDSTVVDYAAYKAATPEARATMRADALRGPKRKNPDDLPEVQDHTRLKNKLERERAKPDADPNTIGMLERQLDEMAHGTPGKPGVVDRYLERLIDRYRKTGELPSTWLFGDAIETAFARIENFSPRGMKGLWLLREHLKPQNSRKVYGSGLTQDEALMSTYFGFRPPSEGAMAAMRRASAKPFEAITTLMPDRYMSAPLYKVSELMARDAGVLPAILANNFIERAWRGVKLGKVAGNPGAHVMSLGSNTLVQAQRRGDVLIGAKAAGTLVDFLRYRAGMKTLVDPDIYRQLELSGRVSGGAVRGEIDATLKRALEDPEFATKDWAGDFMTFGVGRRVYDWWDTMFKIEDGVDQYKRRMRDFDDLNDGDTYTMPISRTKEVELTKVGDKYMLDGKVLTDAQFKQLVGRAAMEPGSRIFVDFKDVPLLSVFKRNFPILDMMMSDFSTWRMVTDTVPFMKEGIVGEIMLGAVPRGKTSNRKIRLKRALESGVVGMERSMMARALSERVSGEDAQMLRSALNRYGGASPVFSVSATADPRVFSVADGTSFSVYDSVERLLRLGEAIAYTAPSKHLGDTIQEWIGFVDPESYVEVPSVPGKKPTKTMLMNLTSEQIEKLPAPMKRHVQESIAFWEDSAKTGGMGRKAWLANAYLEGNLYINLFADLMFETRKEAEAPAGWSVADTMVKSLAPGWASNLIQYGLEASAEEDIQKFQDDVAKLGAEERRIKSILPNERTDADRESLRRIQDPATMEALKRKHLKFVSGVQSLTRKEYRPEAVLGALEPGVAESPLRVLAARMLRGPRAVAVWHQYNYSKTGKKTKRRKGLSAVGFDFKGTVIEDYIDRTSRQFAIGVSDAIAIQKAATFAGDQPYSEGEQGYERLYPAGEAVQSLRTQFRKILLEEAQGMQMRFEEAFGGMGKVDPKLKSARGQKPSGELRQVPEYGWQEDPRTGKRRKFESIEQYFDPVFE